MKSCNKSQLALFILTMLLSFSLNCNAQQDTLIFQWQNTNPFSVTTDVFEVSAPPDTSTILSQVNTAPIPNSCDACEWSTLFTFDDNCHYFRLRSTRFDTLHSKLSNTCSCTTLRHPTSPVLIKILPRYR